MTSNYCDPASVPVPFRSPSPLPLAILLAIPCFPFPFAIAIAARPVAHDRLSDHRKKKTFQELICCCRSLAHMALYSAQSGPVRPLVYATLPSLTLLSRTHTHLLTLGIRIAPFALRNA